MSSHESPHVSLLPRAGGGAGPGGRAAQPDDLRRPGRGHESGPTALGNYVWPTLFFLPFYRSGAVHMSAISGIDMALWDIKGEVAGLPVCELLGGRACGC